MKEWTCEATIGVDDSQYQPKIVLCRAPTNDAYTLVAVAVQVALCEDHAIYFKEHGKIR